MEEDGTVVFQTDPGGGTPNVSGQGTDGQRRRNDRGDTAPRIVEEGESDKEDAKDEGKEDGDIGQRVKGARKGFRVYDPFDVRYNTDEGQGGVYNPGLGLFGTQNGTMPSREPILGHRGAMYEDGLDDMGVPMTGNVPERPVKDALGHDITESMVHTGQGAADMRSVLERHFTPSRWTRGNAAQGCVLHQTAEVTAQEGGVCSCVPPGHQPGTCFYVAGTMFRTLHGLAPGTGVCRDHLDVTLRVLDGAQQNCICVSTLSAVIGAMMGRPWMSVSPNDADATVTCETCKAETGVVPHVPIVARAEWIPQSTWSAGVAIALMMVGSRHLRVGLQVGESVAASLHRFLVGTFSKGLLRHYERIVNGSFPAFRAIQPLAYAGSRIVNMIPGKGSFVSKHLLSSAGTYQGYRGDLGLVDLINADAFGLSTLDDPVCLSLKPDKQELEEIMRLMSIGGVSGSGTGEEVARGKALETQAAYLAKTQYHQQLLCGHMCERIKCMVEETTGLDVCRISTFSPTMVCAYVDPYNGALGPAGDGLPVAYIGSTFRPPSGDVWSDVHAHWEGYRDEWAEAHLRDPPAGPQIDGDEAVDQEGGHPVRKVDISARRLVAPRKAINMDNTWEDAMHSLAGQKGLMCQLLASPVVVTTMQSVFRGRIGADDCIEVHFETTLLGIGVSVLAGSGGDDPNTRCWDAIGVVRRDGGMGEEPLLLLVSMTSVSRQQGIEDIRYAMSGLDLGLQATVRNRLRLKQPTGDVGRFPSGATPVVGLLVVTTAGTYFTRSSDDPLGRSTALESTLMATTDSGSAWGVATAGVLSLSRRVWGNLLVRSADTDSMDADMAYIQEKVRPYSDAGERLREAGAKIGPAYLDMVLEQSNFLGGDMVCPTLATHVQAAFAKKVGGKDMLGSSMGRPQPTHNSLTAVSDQSWTTHSLLLDAIGSGIDELAPCLTGLLQIHTLISSGSSRGFIGSAPMPHLAISKGYTPGIPPGTDRLEIRNGRCVNRDGEARLVGTISTYNGTVATIGHTNIARLTICQFLGFSRAHDSVGKRILAMNGGTQAYGRHVLPEGVYPEKAKTDLPAMAQAAPARVDTEGQGGDGHAGPSHGPATADPYDVTDDPNVCPMDQQEVQGKPSSKAGRTHTTGTSRGKERKEARARGEPLEKFGMIRDVGREVRGAPEPPGVGVPEFSERDIIGGRRWHDNHRVSLVSYFSTEAYNTSHSEYREILDQLACSSPASVSRSLDGLKDPMEWAAFSEMVPKEVTDAASDLATVVQMSPYFAQAAALCLFWLRCLTASRGKAQATSNVIALVSSGPLLGMIGGKQKQGVVFMRVYGVCAGGAGHRRWKNSGFHGQSAHLWSRDMGRFITQKMQIPRDEMMSHVRRSIITIGFMLCMSSMGPHMVTPIGPPAKSVREAVDANMSVLTEFLETNGVDHIVLKDQSWHLPVQTEHPDKLKNTMARPISSTLGAGLYTGYAALYETIVAGSVRQEPVHGRTSAGQGETRAVPPAELDVQRTRQACKTPVMSYRSLLSTCLSMGMAAQGPAIPILGNMGKIGSDGSDCKDTIDNGTGKSISEDETDRRAKSAAGETYRAVNPIVGGVSTVRRDMITKEILHKATDSHPHIEYMTLDDQVEVPTPAWCMGDMRPGEVAPISDQLKSGDFVVEGGDGADHRYSPAIRVTEPVFFAAPGCPPDVYRTSIPIPKETCTFEQIMEYAQRYYLAFCRGEDTSQTKEEIFSCPILVAAVYSLTSQYGMSDLATKDLMKALTGKTLPFDPSKTAVHPFFSKIGPAFMAEMQRLTLVKGAHISNVLEFIVCGLRQVMDEIRMPPAAIMKTMSYVRRAAAKIGEIKPRMITVNSVLWTLVTQICNQPFRPSLVDAASLGVKMLASLSAVMDSCLMDLPGTALSLMGPCGLVPHANAGHDPDPETERIEEMRRWTGAPPLDAREVPISRRQQELIDGPLGMCEDPYSLDAFRSMSHCHTSDLVVIKRPAQLITVHGPRGPAEVMVPAKVMVTDSPETIHRFLGVVDGPELGGGWRHLDMEVVLRVNGGRRGWGRDHTERRMMRCECILMCVMERPVVSCSAMSLPIDYKRYQPWSCTRAKLMGTLALLPRDMPDDIKAIVLMGALAPVAGYQILPPNLRDVFLRMMREEEKRVQAYEEELKGMGLNPQLARCWERISLKQGLTGPLLPDLSLTSIADDPMKMMGYQVTVPPEGAFNLSSANRQALLAEVLIERMPAACMRALPPCMRMLTGKGHHMVSAHSARALMPLQGSMVIQSCADDGLMLSWLVGAFLRALLAAYFALVGTESYTKSGAKSTYILAVFANFVSHMYVMLSLSNFTGIRAEDIKRPSVPNPRYGVKVPSRFLTFTSTADIQQILMPPYVRNFNVPGGPLFPGMSMSVDTAAAGYAGTGVASSMLHTLSFSLFQNGSGLRSGGNVSPFLPVGVPGCSFPELITGLSIVMKSSGHHILHSAAVRLGRMKDPIMAITGKIMERMILATARDRSIFRIPEGLGAAGTHYPLAMSKPREVSILTTKPGSIIPPDQMTGGMVYGDTVLPLGGLALSRNNLHKPGTAEYFTNAMVGSASVSGASERLPDYPFVWVRGEDPKPWTSRTSPKQMMEELETWDGIRRSRFLAWTSLDTPGVLSAKAFAYSGQGIARTGVLQVTRSGIRHIVAMGLPDTGSQSPVGKLIETNSRGPPVLGAMASKIQTVVMRVPQPNINFFGGVHLSQLEAAFRMHGEKYSKLVAGGHAFVSPLVQESLMSEAMALYGMVKGDFQTLRNRDTWATIMGHGKMPTAAAFVVMLHFNIDGWRQGMPGPDAAYTLMAPSAATAVSSLAVATHQLLRQLSTNVSCTDDDMHKLVDLARTSYMRILAGTGPTDDLSLINRVMVIEASPSICMSLLILRAVVSPNASMLRDFMDAGVGVSINLLPARERGLLSGLEEWVRDLAEGGVASISAGGGLLSRGSLLVTMPNAKDVWRIIRGHTTLRKSARGNMSILFDGDIRAAGPNGPKERFKRAMAELEKLHRLLAAHPLHVPVDMAMGCLNWAVPHFESGAERRSEGLCELDQALHQQVKATARAWYGAWRSPAELAAHVARKTEEAASRNRDYKSGFSDRRTGGVLRGIIDNCPLQSGPIGLGPLTCLSGMTIVTGAGIQTRVELSPLPGMPLGMEDRVVVWMACNLSSIFVTPAVACADSRWYDAYDTASLRLLSWIMSCSDRAEGEPAISVAVANHTLRGRSDPHALATHEVPTPLHDHVYTAESCVLVPSVAMSSAVARRLTDDAVRVLAEAGGGYGLRAALLTEAASMVRDVPVPRCLLMLRPGVKEAMKRRDEAMARQDKPRHKEVGLFDLSHAFARVVSCVTRVESMVSERTAMSPVNIHPRVTGHNPRVKAFWCAGLTVPENGILFPILRDMKPHLMMVGSRGNEILALGLESPDGSTFLGPVWVPPCAVQMARVDSGLSTAAVTLELRIAKAGGSAPTAPGEAPLVTGEDGGVMVSDRVPQERVALMDVGLVTIDTRLSLVVGLSKMAQGSAFSIAPGVGLINEILESRTMTCQINSDQMVNIGVPIVTLTSRVTESRGSLFDRMSKGIRDAQRRSASSRGAGHTVEDLAKKEIGAMFHDFLKACVERDQAEAAKDPRYAGKNRGILEMFKVFGRRERNFDEEA